MSCSNKCPICGEVFTHYGAEMSTLLGYMDKPGHNHDDNCLKRNYICPNGHVTIYSIQRTCRCGWKGKEECFCHKGKKIKEWPENIPEKLDLTGI